MMGEARQVDGKNVANVLSGESWEMEVWVYSHGMFHITHHTKLLCVTCLCQGVVKPYN